MRILHYTLLIFFLVLISIPRFNWGKLGPLSSFVGDKPFDVYQYETYTEFFRGEAKKITELEGPFSYRPLTPFLASFLPFKPITSINIINLVALSFCLFIITRILAQFNFGYKYILLGQILFVFSFPVFYYSTTGYIDATLIFFLFTALMLLVKEKYIFFLLVFILGISVKETMIIFVPVAATYLLLNKNLLLAQKIIFLIVMTAIVIVEILAIRSLAPGTKAYIWIPNLEVLVDNLIRVKTYLSFILSFGLPGIGAILYYNCSDCKKYSIELKYALLTGLICAFLLSLFSIFAAYSDGRHIWTSYPFTIPLAVSYFKFVNEKKIKTR